MHFQTLSLTIKEIKQDDSDWSGNDIKRLDNVVVSEMIKDDKDPYFVEFTGLHETTSDNKNTYTADAIKTCVEAMVGVNMYKGHQEPGTESWKYREPVGQVIAARVCEIEVNGKRVLAAKGKAYITEAEQKLRSDIRKKLAGPVSILGDARAIRDQATGIKKITKITSLRSIDFCNPGTGGIATCGVTAVVSEMAGKDEPEEQKMTTRLTKDQLLAEYATEIREIAGKYTEESLTAIANEKKTLVETKSAFETKQKEFETKISEITSAKTASDKKIEELTAALIAEKLARITADLKVHVSVKIAEMKKTAKHELVDLATASVKTDVIDLDLEKSKTAFNTAIDSELGRLVKISEMFGKPKPKDESGGTHKIDNNGGNNGDRKTAYKKLLSPELAKAIDGEKE